METQSSGQAAISAAADGRGEGEVEVAGDARRGVAVEAQAGDGAPERREQPVAQRGDARGLLRHLGARRSGRPRRSPTTSGVGSVPERSPRSWPPPENSGASRTRGRRRT